MAGETLAALVDVVLDLGMVLVSLGLFVLVAVQAGKVPIVPQ